MRAFGWVLAVVLATTACKSKDSSSSSGSGSAPPAPPGDTGPQVAELADASDPVWAPLIDARAPDPESSYRWYRVEAIIDDLGRVPWIIGVHRERPEGLVWGPEERLPLAVLGRDPLRVRIPIRGIELAFTSPESAKRLDGTLLTNYYYKRNYSLVAVPIEAPRVDVLFPGTQPPVLDMNGAWTFEIQDFGVGRGMFRQDARGIVMGTIIPPEVGDLRHLTGRVTGNRVQLQAFDGIHTFLIDMTSKDGGKTVSGAWVVGGIGKQTLSATRAAPPATHVKVSARMAPGKTKLSLPQLDQLPYKGQPVIVDYFGSWCPVCIDLTPELVRFQRERAAKGLQVLSFALEPPGDEAETRRRLDEFRAQFGMTWPFEIIYTEDFNGAVVPEIVDATGFPVTVFLRRDHTVAAIHTGFISKAAGPEREAAIKLLESYVEQIVASPPPSP